MYIKGGETRLYDNLFRQLSAYWGESDKNIIQECVPETLKRVEKILSHIPKTNKYVWQDNQIVFSPIHSVQYSVFLYLLSNTLCKYRGYRRGRQSLLFK